MEYDPSSYAVQADPFAVYRWIRDDAPLYRNDRLDFWALARFDDVHAALADHSTYSSAAGVQLESSAATLGLQAEIMLNTDPPKHTQLRTLVSRAFTPRRVASIEHDVRALCRELLDRMADAGGGELVDDLAAIVPITVITSLVGLPLDHRDALRTLTDRVNHREPGSIAPPADASVAGAELYRLFGGVVTERQANPRNDMATALIEAEVTDTDGIRHRLDDNQITMFYLLLAVAGYETTSKLISNAVVALERFPDQRQLLLDEPSLIPNAVEEVLRHDGSTHYTARVTTTDVEWHGDQVPAGSRMLLVMGAANRDDREFDDPDRIDVRRDIRRHLSFGHGIHFCLGAALARLEARVVLEELLARAPGYRVDLDGLERKYGSNFRGLSRVPITMR